MFSGETEGNSQKELNLVCVVFPWTPKTFPFESGPFSFNVGSQVWSHPSCPRRAKWHRPKPFGSSSVGVPLKPTLPRHREVQWSFSNWCMEEPHYQIDLPKLVYIYIAKKKIQEKRIKTQHIHQQRNSFSLCNQLPLNNAPSARLGCPRRANKISAPSSCPLAESFLFWNLATGMYGNQRVASQDLTYKKSNIIINIETVV